MGYQKKPWLEDQESGIKKAETLISKWEERAYKKTKRKKSSIKELIHSDFLTPEYKSFNVILNKKWETCRGIGNSFGYNKFESEEDYAKSEEIIKMLIDTVEKYKGIITILWHNTNMFDESCPLSLF